MMGTVQEKVTGAFWWMGWRPLVVGSLGGVIGVLVGYAVGALGPATAAVGVLLISVSALVGWLRRIGIISAAVTFVIFFIVGPGRAEQALEDAGIGAEWTRFVAEFVLNIGSLVGVEPSGEPTAVVGGGVAALALWSLAGAAAGGGVWLAGVYAVNAKYAEVYRDFVGSVEEEGRALLGDDAFHTFTHGEETVPLVSSAKKYHATNLLVGDSSLSLHHGSTIDMVGRDENVSDSTKELYYDQVASVDYEAPYLKIGMSDGQVVRIVTSGKPVDVINEIEEHLQRYKTSSDRDVSRGSEDTTDGERQEDDEAVETGNVEETSQEATERGKSIVDEVDEVLDAFGEAVDGGSDKGEDGEKGAGDDEDSQKEG